MRLEGLSQVLRVILFQPPSCQHIPTTPLTDRHNNFRWRRQLRHTPTPRCRDLLLAKRTRRSLWGLNGAAVDTSFLHLLAAMKFCHANLLTLKVLVLQPRYPSPILELLLLLQGQT